MTRVFLIFFLVMTAATPAGAVLWPELVLEPAVGGLSSPVYVTHAGDGSGRLFVVEQEGKIRIAKDGQVATSSFLDITDRVLYGGERGLLSAAFPPSFGESGRFYVYYTAQDGNNVVARFHVSAEDTDAADPESEEIVLILEHPDHENHNGGQLAFSPMDGYLYIGTGDGGGGGDPEGNAQNLQSLLGKILRIDPESAESGYLIPADNPFTADSDPSDSARDEIWAYGLRNPWRFSFDRLTGDLYIGDVGQNRMEEVDFQPAEGTGGDNYGWNLLEGSLCYPSGEAPPACEPPADYAAPVVEYGRSDGQAVTGGFVYRGPARRNMEGVYFFADYVSGRLWGLQRNQDAWSLRLLFVVPFHISTFGEDEFGNLYVADYQGGTLYQLTSREYPDGIFKPDDQSVNAYVQTYTTGSVLVILTWDLNAWYAFLDEDWTDGIQDQVDLAGLGQRLSMEFSETWRAQMTLTSVDGDVHTWSLTKRFRAPEPGSQVDGIYKLSDDSMNIFLQTYEQGSAVAVVTPDLDSWYAFVVPDWSEGIENVVDLSGAGHHLTMNFTAANRASGVFSYADGISVFWSLIRKFKAPDVQ